MQISRRILLACTATTLCLPSVLLAQDNDAQIKARQALEQKMRETGSQTTTTPAEPAPAAVQATPQTPAEPAPSVASSDAPVLHTPPPPVATLDAIERARDAMRQKMTESKPSPVVQASPAEVKTPAPKPSTAKADAKAAAKAEAQAKAKAEAEAKAAAKAEKAVVKVEKETVKVEADASADAAIRQAVLESEKAAAEKAAAQNSAPSQQPTQAKQTKTVAKVRPEPQPAMLEPMQAPPTGIAASKEQRLSQLLQQYKADSVTPEQYHVERAKILSEP